MSRSLDKGTKEALKNGDHKDVYEDLAAVFAAPQLKVMEIEFLPRSHSLPPGTSFLQDGQAIAIPKAQLVQAFIYARKELQKYLENPDVAVPEKAMKATSVMLLLDSEHLTAANTRKRIIMRVLETDEGNIRGILLHEKHFMDSMLTSRLHRHTKSPTLWSHRRWLLQKLRDAGTTRLDPLYELGSVVFVSAERHPRNYYAWWHARHLVLRGDVDPRSANIVAVTKKWCFAHHNDVSGWSFLNFLLDKNQNAAADVFSETLHLAQKFLWRNESVWHFLRSMMLQPTLARHLSQLDFEKTLNVLREGVLEDSKDAKTLDEALSWLRVNFDLT